MDFIGVGRKDKPRNFWKDDIQRRMREKGLEWREKDKWKEKIRV